MFAKTLVLALTGFLSFVPVAQPAESPQVRNRLPGESAGDTPAAADLNDKCSGPDATWTEVNGVTRKRAKIYTGCKVENTLEKAKAGWNALTKQDQKLIEQIELAAKLLEEANSYSESLDAELIAIRASKQWLLSAIAANTVARRELNRHNDTVKQAANKCFDYLSRIEATFTTLIELEQKTGFMQPEAQAALLDTSTEVIAGLEAARTGLSAKWGELQGLQVYH